MSAVFQNDLVHDPSTNQPGDLNSILAAEAIDKEVVAADAWARVVAIATAEQATQCQDAIDRLNALWNKYEAERKTEKAPFDAAALAVQKRWRPSLSKLEACIQPIVALRGDWLRRENERLEREREAAGAAVHKAAEEAFVAASEASPGTPVSAKLVAEAAAERAKQAEQDLAAIPDRARVGGSYGRPARSLREYWFAEVQDVLKAARHYRNHPDLRDRLAKLASADARSGARYIPGCEVKSRKE